MPEVDTLGFVDPRDRLRKMRAGAATAAAWTPMKTTLAPPSIQTGRAVPDAFPYPERWAKVLENALEDLYEAQRAYVAPVHPPMPIGMPRVFRFVEPRTGGNPHPGIQWPHGAWEGRAADPPIWTFAIVASGSNTQFDIARPEGRAHLATRIVALCYERPRLVLRALRRIQCATSWTILRRRGLEKSARQLMDAQAKAVQALEVEAAGMALRGES